MMTIERGSGQDSLIQKIVRVSPKVRRCALPPRQRSVEGLPPFTTETLAKVHISVAQLKKENPAIVEYVEKGSVVVPTTRVLL